MIIPIRWRNVLTAIQAAGYPEAIIAGGALRDLDNAAPIKDVDIFINARGSDFDKLAQKLGNEGADLTEFSTEYEQHNPSVGGVYEFYLPEIDQPVQVIACKGCYEHAGAFREQQLDRFDIGLCKVAFDGTKVHYTSPYCLDKAERQLRITTGANLPASITRVKRIGEKYPEWKLVNFDGTAIEREQEEFSFV